MKVGKNIEFWMDDYGHTINIKFGKQYIVRDPKGGIIVKMSPKESTALAKYMDRS